MESSRADSFVLKLSPRVCSDSCSLSQWCYITISSSVTPFSSCPPSFPASGSFPMSWLFAPGGQRIGVSATATVLPMNIQGWFPLRLTALISLLSKGLSRVFPSTSVWKHQSFSAQPSLWFSSHFCTCLPEKPQFWLDKPLSAKWCLVKSFGQGLRYSISHNLLGAVCAASLGIKLQCCKYS